MNSNAVWIKGTPMGDKEWQIANTYHSIRKMIESDDALLPLSVRLKLAEQIFV